MRHLERKARVWYRDHLVGTEVVNADTGWTIGFQTRGAKNIGGRQGPDLYRIVPAIKEILEKGMLIRTEQDTKGREKLVEAWHTFAARVLLDGAEKDVIVKVRKTAQGRFHYDISKDWGDGAKFSRTSATDRSQSYGLEDTPPS
ncbi:hypothetical protein [Haematobacter missouriensis]|uniref:LPD3 domain-containing protein n=1 Tax=Haematobacter missouriensis TaxID=366616 RepID=UPI0022B92EF6|nr:hypothetical protein [Haematobacter missouriensis]